MKTKRAIALGMAVFTFAASVPTEILNANIDQIAPANWHDTPVGTRLPQKPHPSQLTGLYSSALSPQIDFAQSRQIFEQQARQYVADGFIETFHQVGATTPITYLDTGMGNNWLQFPNYIRTGVGAFDLFTPRRTLGLDITHAQWLVNNDVFLRFNQEIIPHDGGLWVSPAVEAPWGVENSVNAVTRDEFVVSLSRAAHGVIESRPIFLETEAYRMARAGFWWEVWHYQHTFAGDQPITVWTFRGYDWNEEFNPPEGLPRARHQEDIINMDLLRRQGDFIFQQVNHVIHSGNAGPGINWGPNSAGHSWGRPSWTENGHTCRGWTASGSSCNGQIGELGANETIIRHHWRGEFVSNTENFTHPIVNTFTHDYWSYVSGNVWELYIFDFLSRGILHFDEVFRSQNLDNNSLDFTGIESDTFELNRQDIQEEMLREFLNYGLSNPQTGVISFPQFAPELGVSVNGDPMSIRSLNVYNFNADPSISVLGRNYQIGNFLSEMSGEQEFGIQWNVSNPNTLRAQMNLPETQFFQHQSMTVISALRLIESVLRVEENNMSELEASIITQRYGARYLDNIPQRDRVTVEFLIAHGIIDFENFDEYANLYSILDRDFAFTLIYRFANPNARTHFSQVMVTDSAGIDLNSGFNNYQNRVAQNRVGDLDNFVDQQGILRHNAFDPNSREFSMAPSVHVDSVRRGETHEQMMVVTLNIDDPLRYLYRGIPLVLTEFSFAGQGDTSWNIMDGFTSSPGEWYLPPGYNLQSDRARIFTAGVNHNGTGEVFPGQVSLRVHPGNMVGSRDLRVIEGLQDFLEHLEQNETPTNDFRTFNQRQWLPGISYTNVSDPSGIRSVRTDPNRQGRYLVEISIAAIDPSSAVNFVMANMTSLTEGLLQEVQDRTSGVHAQTGQLFVDSTAVQGLHRDGDILRVGDQNVMSNRNVTLMGGQIVQGVSENLEGAQAFPHSLVQSMSPNNTRSSLGRQDTIQMNNPILNRPTARSFHGNNHGTVQVRTLTLTDNPQQQDFLNVSTSAPGDMFYQTRTIQMDLDARNAQEENTSVEHNMRIVLDLRLSLPTLAEQAILAQTEPINPNPRSVTASNWIYTRPNNPELQQFWDYNIEVTNAIMAELGLEGTPIQSGFLVPSLTFLIDVLPNHGGQFDFEAQVEEVVSDFLQAVGNRIDPAWADQFLGFATAFNSILDYDVQTNLHQLGVLTPQNVGFRLQTGELQDSIIQENRFPIWAEVFFDHQAAPNQMVSTFLQSRQAGPSVEAFNILRVDGASYLYGSIDSVTGDDGDQSEAVNVRFAVDQTGNLLRNIHNINYQWFPEHQLMVYTPQAFRNHSSIQGQVFSIGDNNFTVAHSDSSEIQLVSETTIQGVIRNGQLVDHTTGHPLQELSNQFIANVFAPHLPAGVSLEHVVNFQPVNSGNLTVFPLFNQHIAEIVNGEIRVHMITQDPQGSPQRTEVAVQEGQSVEFRPFVRLNASTWAVSPLQGTLQWQRSFVGADPAYYNPRNNLRIMETSMLPHDSENLVSLADLESGPFYIGELRAYLHNDGSISMQVPFQDGFFQGEDFNLGELLRYLQTSGMLVNAGGESFLDTDFISILGIETVNGGFGGYNNTMVLIDGRPFVVSATGTPRQWTPASQVDTISLNVQIDPQVVFWTVRDIAGRIDTARMHGIQPVLPVSTIGQRLYNEPHFILSVNNLSNFGVVALMEVANVPFLQEGMMLTFNIGRANIALNTFGIILIASGLLLTALLFVIRTLQMPLGVSVRTKFSYIKDTSGLDLFKLGSWGLMDLEQVGDEIPSWFKVTSFAILIVLVVIIVLTIIS